MKKWIDGQMTGVVSALVSALLIGTAADAKLIEGFTEPYSDIEVSVPGEPSRIIDIQVKEGAQVRKNDVLAILDTAVLDASLEIAKKRASMNGRILAAEAERDLRQSRYDKLRALRDRGHASPIELKRAEADLAVAKANLVLATEEHDLATLECRRIEAQIDKQHLRSPIDGVVVEVHKEVGEATQISDSRMFRLVQLNQLRVKFPVSVHQASQFSNGDRIEVSFPETSSRAFAIVELVSPLLDAGSGTVTVSCVVDNSKGQVRCGMRCLLEIEGEIDDEDEQDDKYQDFDTSGL